MSEKRGGSGVNSSRRGFLRLAGGAVAAGGVAGCLGGGGDGQSTPEYPTETVRFVVPYSAGGGFDAYARLMESYWEDSLDTEIQVENVTGGGGVVGATQVWNADPDGYTVMDWEPKEGLMPQIGGDVQFDLREMSHFGFFTQAPNGLNIMNATGIESWDGLVDNMAELNWGTQGQGSSAHMLPIILGELTGAWSADDMNFVHYDGTSEVLGGLERGEVNTFMPGTADSGAKVAQGLDAKLLIVFGSPGGTFGEYIDSTGIDEPIWSSTLDVDNMDRYADLTVFRRFMTGPPDVPEYVRSMQEESLGEALDNEELHQQGWDAARPFINPEVGKEPVDEVLDKAYDVLTQEPFVSILEETLGG